MAEGLQVFNEKGQLIFDISSDTAEYLGDVETGIDDGSITDERIAGRAVWYVVLGPVLMDNIIKRDTPRISYKGNTISWVFKVASGDRANIRFIYGVY